MSERPANAPPAQGRDKIVCSCGNLIDFGTLRPGPGTREVREHPACGRNPNVIRAQDVAEALAGRGTTVRV